MRRVWWAAAALCLSAAVLWALWFYNIFPHARRTGEDFGIARYLSPCDRDGDGVDDQSDILAGARAYISAKPQYGSKYYPGGWPDDGCGVCTDVAAQALLAAGYDLQALLAADIAAAPEAYPQIEMPDPNIDFRRVVNLQVYFARNAQPLTTDPRDIAAWQGGDIVIFPHHIAIVSDVRNRWGVPFLIHHANPYQLRYEEDVMAHYRVVGHYRMG